MSSVKTVDGPVKQEATPVKKSAPVLNRVLDFLSSVKFGVVLLCFLVLLSIVGMLIVQQNVNGFDSYYAGLTPAQVTVYGALGLFDIYHSWYYNVLLLVLSLNIVLASIDRFPSAWSYIVRPKLSATANWLRGRMSTAEVRLEGATADDVADRVAAAMKNRGLKPTITESHILRYDGTVTGGTFSLSVVEGEKRGKTGPIPFDATASEIRQALIGKSEFGKSEGVLVKPKDILVSGTLNTSVRITKPRSESGDDEFVFLVDDAHLQGGNVISERVGTNGVFAESGKWNRLGAYTVHVCLLTLFLGHFVALQTGFDADVGFQPGQTTSEIELIQFDLDKQNRFAASLPFSITCTDISQKLIDPNGPIEVFNTLDWVTSIRIDDPDYGVTKADVGLNRPFSYRGYRFFQAQTVPIGNARSIKLMLTPETEGAKPVEVVIKRTGDTTLSDGTRVKYEEFLPDFTFNDKGQPDTRSGDYNNPAAVLNVTPKNGQPVRVFAFAGDLTDNMPVGAAKAGYKWKLKEFEKSPRAHILSIKYDPYNGAFISWYFGGIGLIGALIFVFFFSHRRVWAVVSKAETGFEALLGGETNRNHQGFEERFNRLVADLGGDTSEKEDKSD